jgi:hypothetical protein
MNVPREEAPQALGDWNPRYYCQTFLQLFRSNNVCKVEGVFLNKLREF